jgi:hypothetical protein
MDNNGWINVKDRLPEMSGFQDGGTDRVLVYLKRNYSPRQAVAFGDWSENGFTWYFDYSHMLKDSEVTHWQPLPTPPN